MEKKVELLAPAGNYEAFLGAVNAGADAVYLGGEQFGARAYADNFTTEEILRALHVAHFYGKKIYLTVNTLLKERELATLSDYLTPFYEAGLDGVIVQDPGVLHNLREHFPGLSLHASTQMTVTGVRGATLLKEAGVSRVVPARELSLQEVQRIREEAGVEVECFIHGAMCYCYSGQCLFSSILGGRSGNRGRCAQPCRLPYEIFEGKKRLAGEGYPLSLKDMCTLEYLPALIGAGIDSFKIEGRMKRPEYAAGVTAIYRKYIDRCYGDSARYQVEKADLDRLKRLYIRSEIQTGYYERHNGKEMITLEKPGYEGCDEALLGKIREAYIREPERMPVRLKARVAVDEPLKIQISSAWEDDGTAKMTGETVQPAKKAPLTEEAVRKQLTKMGDSLLCVTGCEIEMVGEGFVPVRALNELRRAAVAAFEAVVCEAVAAQKPGSGTEEMDGKVLSGMTQENLTSAKEGFRQNMNKDRPGQSTQKDAKSSGPAANRRHSREVLYHSEEGKREPARPIHALTATLDQLRAAVSCGCTRIYIESDLFLRERDAVCLILKSGEGQGIAKAGIAGSVETDAGAGEWQPCTYYLALPYILRARDEDWLRRLTEVLRTPETSGRVQGFLIRSLEGLAFVRDVSERTEEDVAYSLVADAGLYCFNGEAAAFLADYVDEITLPYELNAGEAAHLTQAAERHGLSANLIVYSHIPMMVTANCLAKTADACRNGAAKGEKAGSRIGEERQIFLKDRKEIAFPVVLNCDHCYNVLYNAVPYSLHTAVKEKERIAASAYRYDFTTEAGEACEQILRGTYAFSGYTAGHCKRGVE